jgi:hypothetical protein
VLVRKPTCWAALDQERGMTFGERTAWSHDAAWQGTAEERRDPVEEDRRNAPERVRDRGAPRRPLPRLRAVDRTFHVYECLVHAITKTKYVSGMNRACDRYDASTGTFHDRDGR